MHIIKTRLPNFIGQQIRKMNIGKFSEMDSRDAFSISLSFSCKSTTKTDIKMASAAFEDSKYAPP